MASRRQQREGANPFAREPLSVEEADQQLFGGRDRMIALSAIRLDGGTQPRTRLDEETIQEYTEAMQREDVFPSVIVFDDGEQMWLTDGFHRYHAATRAGRGEIRADIQQGSLRDAVIYSTGVNATHGLRRTNDDKRRAVLTLLADPEWTSRSNRDIARQCHVDEKTVRSWRDSSLSAEIPQSEETREQKTPPTRTGVDGREYRIDRIQKAARKRAARGSSHKVSGLIPDSDRPAELPVESDRPAQPRGLYAGTPSRPTSPQIQRAVIGHLEAAAAGLEQLGMVDHADSLLDYVRERKEEWNL